MQKPSDETDFRVEVLPIKGAKFTELKGLGHFAMCENYGLFKTYLMPVLKEIAGKP